MFHRVKNVAVFPAIHSVDQSFRSLLISHSYLMRSSIPTCATGEDTGAPFFFDALSSGMYAPDFSNSIVGDSPTAINVLFD